MKVILVTLLAANLAMLVMAASIFDYLSDPVARDTETKRNCLCNGPSCICCVDFNISFIDLGGPGCVRMNYISADEGIAINVSYGDSLLHSQTVRGPDPAPTCLNVFSSIAQMCARFRELLPTDDGLRGCVNIEPMLLGTPQLEFPIGCFRMGPNGMQVIESASDVIKEQTPGNGAQPPVESAEDDDDDDDEVAPAPPAAGAAGTIAGYNTVDILSAVSDSAEEGIALLSSWFGLGTSGNGTTTTPAPDTDPATDEEDAAAAATEQPHTQDS